MKTLTLSPDRLFIYLFIFSGNQMQYLSVDISACDVTFLVSRQVMVMAQCVGMIISQDLRLVFLTLAG